MAAYNTLFHYAISLPVFKPHTDQETLGKWSTGNHNDD